MLNRTITALILASFFLAILVLFNDEYFGIKVQLIVASSFTLIPILAFNEWLIITKTNSASKKILLSQLKISGVENIFYFFQNCQHQEDEPHTGGGRRRIDAVHRPPLSPREQFEKRENTFDAGKFLAATRIISLDDSFSHNEASCQYVRFRCSSSSNS